MTPELVWEDLKREGFDFRGDPQGSDEDGRFLAHRVLNPAFAMRRISGNTARHRSEALP